MAAWNYLCTLLFHNNNHHRTDQGTTNSDVEDRGTVQGPGLDEVEEGLLSFLRIHVEEALVVHCNGLMCHTGQQPRRECVSNHLPIVHVCSNEIPKLYLGSKST